VLYLPVSATLQVIGDDPVVVREKRGFVPLRKTSKNRIWDCGLLGSTHRIMFGGEKSWKQLRSIRGTRHDDDDGQYLDVRLSIIPSVDVIVPLAVLPPRPASFPVSTSLAGSVASHAW